MKNLWMIICCLGFAVSLGAAPLEDPFVKNLTLVGVIHVEGQKSRSRSVAVLREKNTGKTRILHQGDTILDGDLEVLELAPQQIILARAQQRFVLRVEIQAESTAFAGILASPEPTEAEAQYAGTDAEAPLEATIESAVSDISLYSSSDSSSSSSADQQQQAEMNSKAKPQRFEPKVIQELVPEDLCDTDSCRDLP
jgi:hypothetical protein